MRHVNRLLRYTGAGYTSPCFIPAHTAAVAARRRCPHLDATPLSPILAKILQVSGEPLVPTCIHLPRPQSGAQIFQVRYLLPRTVSANSWRTLTSEYPVRAEGWAGGWVGGERMGRGNPQPRTRKSEEDGGLEVGMGEQMGGKHEFRAAEVPLSVIEARPIAVTPATNQLGIWSLSFCALSHHTAATPPPYPPPPNPDTHHYHHGCSFVFIAGNLMLMSF